MNIKVWVCTRCWLKENEIPSGSSWPVTANMESDVVYVVPHKPECREVAA